MTSTSRFAMLAALALAFASTADAAPRASRNPECAPLGRIFSATVRARQKGETKAEMERLTAMLDGDMKAKAMDLINRVYSDPVFETAPPATAAAFFSASCR